MKRIRFTLTLLVAACLALAALSAPALAVELGSTASINVTNMDLFRGKNLDVDADFFVTPKVTLRAENVARGALSGSYAPMIDENGLVVRSTLQLDYKLPLLVYNNRADVSVGGIFYLNQDSPNTKEVFVKAQFTEAPLRPELTAYLDVDEAEGEGAYFTLGASHTERLSKTVLTRVRALASYNMESSKYVGLYSDLNTYESGLDVEWTPMTGIQITPSVTYSMAASDAAEEIGGIEDEVLYGLKLAINF